MDNPKPAKPEPNRALGCQVSGIRCQLPEIAGSDRAYVDPYAQRAAISDLIAYPSHLIARRFIDNYFLPNLAKTELLRD